MDTKKILVVEDDEFLREIYVETLTQEGYQIETAEDGDQAFEKIKQGGWDLVLLDIILPKRDGLEVVKSLREDPNFHFPNPIVFLTNLDNDDQIKQALEFGHGYLIKSQITPGDLIREVKMYLEKATQQS
jgi:two-component system, OmpR family, alkaline phosphatase synthesis response regulator PhoP